MNILAFDTADQILSLALECKSGFYFLEIDKPGSHLELLMESTDSLCKKAGILPGELDKIICMRGPGSFTGLRIGYSAAKGLSLALGIPLISIPTLDCLAYHLSFWQGLVISAIDAKNNFFFAAFYLNGERISPQFDISVEMLAEKLVKIPNYSNLPLIITGWGANLLKTKLEPIIRNKTLNLDSQYQKGRARELILLAKDDKLKENDIISGPIYIRKSDAELKFG